MIKLYDSNVTDILPEALAEKPEVIALGYAFKKAMQRLIEFCQNTSVYAVIDQLPDNILDILALELDTQYYEESFDIETKRRLIKNTLVWYMSSGTPAAVEELVVAVFGEGEVTEWFEYGGAPYFFKIKTNATLTEDGMAAFLDMISRVKNTRSHVDAIEVKRTIEQTVQAGCAARQWIRSVIIDTFAADAMASISIYPAAGSWSWSKPPAIMEQFDEHQTASVAAISDTGNGRHYTKNTIREEEHGRL